MPGAVLQTDPATFFAASKPAGDVEPVTQFVQAKASVVNTCSYRLNHLNRSVSELFQDIFQDVSSSPSLQGPNSPLPKRPNKFTQRQLRQQQHLQHRQPQQPPQLHKLHQHKLHRHSLDQRAAVCGTSHPPLQRPGPRTSQRLLSPIAQSHRHSRHQSQRPSPRTPRRPRRPQRVESRTATRTATTMGTRVRITATAMAHRAPTAHARVPMSPTPDPKPVPDNPSKTRTSGLWLSTSLFRCSMEYEHH